MAYAMGCALSPLWAGSVFVHTAHSLCCGLHSFAPSELLHSQFPI